MTSLTGDMLADGTRDIDAPVAAGPVRDAERITALDVTRGIALLGIVLVNVHYFGAPLGDMVEGHKPPKDAGAMGWTAWFVLRTFLEGKFFTVFSTLFGAGLTIQWLRAHERGRSLAPMALRRLGFLMALGLAHGWLMWYGDILFIYSLCGLVLLIPLHFRWSARVQMVVACGALVMGSLAWAGLSLLSAAGRSVEASHIEVGVPATAGPSELVAPVAGGPAVAESGTGDVKAPFGRLMEHWQAGRGHGPAEPEWRDNEIAAYREGPWLQAFLFRAMTWASMIFIVIVGMGWGVVAMFLTGSALIKADVFRVAPDWFFWKLVWGAVLVGMPLSLASTWCLASEVSWVTTFVGTFLILPSGAAVAMGIIGGVTLWVRSGRGAVVARLIANTGRFGLTNYLLQTVVCTAIFYHWGLRQFGRLSPPEMMGLALCIWVAQVGLSAIAVRWLRYGPMEWLWRTFTYWEAQPFLRRDND